MKSDYLIIFNGVIKPVGGQAGYIYNLRTSDYFTIISKKEQLIKKSVIKLFLKRILPTIFIEYLGNIKQKNKFLNEFENYKTFYIQNIDSLRRSKTIHFHETKALYYFYLFDKNLAKSKILLLTSHNPVPTYIELFDRLISIGVNKDISNLIKSKQLKMDVEAFKLANYIVFPNSGAVNPYKTFFFENNIIINDKFKYILTGTEYLKPKILKYKYREKYKIKEDIIVFGYIGRKNKIKGFDLFCECIDYFKENKNVFFVSAGTGDIKYEGNSLRYLDIGWTDDPASFLESLDVLLVPNMDTYFDLGVIQALSLGINIITTETGGNLWFKDKEIVHLVNPNIRSLVNFISKYLDYSDIQYSKLNIINKFNKYFDTEVFAENYFKLYKSLKQ